MDTHTYLCILFVLSFTLIINANAFSQSNSPYTLKKRNEAIQLSNCDVVFGSFSMQRAKINKVLPNGFKALDNLKHPQYDKAGDLSIFYYSCTTINAATEKVVLVGSRINKPAVKEQKPQNKINMYEYVRIVETAELDRRYSAMGFNVLRGDISPAKNKGITVSVSGTTHFDIRLQKSKTYQLGSTLWFWHRSGDQLINTHFNFDINPWSMGPAVNDCRANFKLETMNNLPSVECDTSFIRSSSGVDMKKSHTRWAK